MKMFWLLLLAILPLLHTADLNIGDECITPNLEKAICKPLSQCNNIREAVLSRNSDAIQFAQASQCGYDGEALLCCGNETVQTVKICTTTNGEKAKCVPLAQCPALLNANPAPNFQCGYENGVALVCCGPENTPSSPTPDLDLDGATMASPILSPWLPDRKHCGYDKYSDRVYGGEVTNIGEFPWMALLRYNYTDDGSDAGFKCGGTLINNRYVMTAAHCILINPAQGYDIDSVRLGEWRMSTEKDCTEDLANEECALPVIDLKFENIIVHKQYTRRTAKNDIALIRLEKNVEFTDYVRAICLPPSESPEPAVGTKLVVAGWGATENDTFSDVKLKVELPLVSKSYCNEKITQRGPIGTTQLCAGALAGKDSCQGDSGGPLMVNMGNDVFEPAHWYQEGIVSWGSGCAVAGVPGIYTRVSMYVQWIVDHLEEF